MCGLLQSLLKSQGFSILVRGIPSLDPVPTLRVWVRRAPSSKSKDVKVGACLGAPRPASVRNGLGRRLRYVTTTEFGNLSFGNFLIV